MEPYQNLVPRKLCLNHALALSWVSFSEVPYISPVWSAGELGRTRTVQWHGQAEKRSTHCLCLCGKSRDSFSICSWEARVMFKWIRVKKSLDFRVTYKEKLAENHLCLCMERRKELKTPGSYFRTWGLVYPDTFTKGWSCSKFTTPEIQGKRHWITAEFYRRSPLWPLRRSAPCFDHHALKNLENTLNNKRWYGS